MSLLVNSHNKKFAHTISSGSINRRGWFIKFFLCVWSASFFSSILSVFVEAHSNSDDETMSRDISNRKKIIFSGFSTATLTTGENFYRNYNTCGRFAYILRYHNATMERLKTIFHLSCSCLELGSKAWTKKIFYFGSRRFTQLPIRCGYLERYNCCWRDLEVLRLKREIWILCNRVRKLSKDNLENRQESEN